MTNHQPQLGGNQRIEVQIRRYVLDNFLFSDDENQLRNEASFLEEGVVDSTGVLELVLFVEETFGVTVEDDELLPENFDSVNQLATYVRAKLGEGVHVGEPVSGG
ncbi:MAG: acyl carrier protein [Chloroflexota bacterium]|nr:acyl carrier protein [Chloroflexota bacterium]